MVITIRLDTKQTDGRQRACAGKHAADLFRPWRHFRFRIERRHGVKRRLAVVPQECSPLQMVEGLAKLLLRVHDDRTVPCDRLFERFAGDQKKTNPILSGLHLHFVAKGDHEGRMHSFQLWANLPSSLKMTAPRY